MPDAIRTRCTRLGATQELLDIEEVEGPSLGLDNLLDEGPKSFESMMVTIAMFKNLLPMFSKKMCSFSVGVGLIVVVKDGLKADGTTRRGPELLSKHQSIDLLVLGGHREVRVRGLLNLSSNARVGQLHDVLPEPLVINEDVRLQGESLPKGRVGNDSLSS